MVAAVLMAGEPTRAAPGGITRWALAEAMAEDVLGVLTALDGVAEAVVPEPAWAGVASRIVWPTTVLADVPAGVHRLGAAFAALATLGFHRAVLVAPDAPDLPALHLAKILRALDSAPLAAVPAHGGGMVALAARLEPPSGEPVQLPGDLDGLVPPGTSTPLAWRRMRSPSDLAQLDPGLEGWESTRTLLGL